MKTFIYTPPYKKNQPSRLVQFITKHSNGMCLVMRTYQGQHTGRTYIRKFWTHKDNLALPEKSPVGLKPKPGVKQSGTTHKQTNRKES